MTVCLSKVNSHCGPTERTASEKTHQRTDLHGYLS